MAPTELQGWRARQLSQRTNPAVAGHVDHGASLSGVPARCVWMAALCPRCHAFLRRPELTCPEPPTPRTGRAAAVSVRPVHSGWRRSQPPIADRAAFDDWERNRPHDGT